MHGAREKYCKNCGKSIDIYAIKCPHCHTWQDKDNISRNHLLNSYVSPEHKQELEKSSQKEIIEHKNQAVASGENKVTGEAKEKIVYSDVLVIRRLLLLLIVGGGLYTLWWYYKNNSLLKERFNRNISPILRTIGFIIPVVRWFMFYLLLHDYEKLIREEKIESYSSILNTLIYMFIPIIGPIWTICNIQESINNLWYKTEPNLPVRRQFTSGEIVFLIVLLLLIICSFGLIILCILFVASIVF